MPEFEDLRPALSSTVAQVVTDKAGGVAYGGGVEPQDNVAFGGPTADFILYGVVDGSFAQGPPNPNDFIDPQANPMPYWSGPVQVSGGAIQVSWVADASSPSGHNLRFTINPGAAGDEAYMEQIDPIGGDGAQLVVGAIRASFANNGATQFTGTLEGQFLTASLSTTGSAFSATQILAGGAADWEGASLTTNAPEDAFFLRIRVGAKRGATAASASGSMDIRTVRAYRSGDVFLPDGQSLGGTPVRLFSGLNRLSAQLIGEANPWVVFDPGASGGRTLYLGDGTNIDTRIVRSAAGVMGVSGHQGARANTGGTIAAGAQADVALTWPNAFPDTNYTIAVSAGINDATSRNAPSVMIREETKTASGFTVRVTNNTAATAVTIYVEALAIHD